MSAIQMHYLKQMKRLKIQNYFGKDSAFCRFYHTLGSGCIRRLD